MDNSNTTENNEKKPGGVTGKGFVKGDPRINRKGRPKSFDALRALAQEIGHEVATSNGQPLVIDGHIVTVTEALLRKMASSKDWRERLAFLECAFGKPKAETEITGNLQATSTSVTIYIPDNGRGDE